MDIELKQVSRDEKEVLKNLLEKYDYEFSQWDKRDVNMLGLFGYDYLDYYWTESKRWAYFIFVDRNLAGFAMVNDLPEVDDQPTDFQLAEFCILPKYRRCGIGKKAVFRILEIHSGKWQLKLHPSNIPSVHFWKHVIHEFTAGMYELKRAYPRTEYADGTPGDIFFFSS
ncbi:GNAT family N-acetyltransferase [Spirochaeta dissipatitropha]